LTGRSGREASNAFVASIRAALACFAPNAHVVPVGYSRPHDAIGLTLAAGGAVPLRDAGRRHVLDLTLEIYYRLADGEAGCWDVRTAAYSYGLEQPSALDRPPEPILRYDWHPHVVGQTRPHLHIEEALGDRATVNARTHLVTGYVTLVDVLAYTVREHGVAIQQHQDDWTQRLQLVHQTLLTSLDWAAPARDPIRP
jgi:hypothetical protein